MSFHIMKKLPGLVLIMLSLAGCDIREVMLKSAMEGQADYFKTPDTAENTLTRINDRVYSYNWYFDRTLVIRTDAGLVVVDPFSPHLVGGLKKALTDEGIDDPVHTLIYSHYHLDHVRGGAQLKPQRVVSHKKSPQYWADFNGYTDDILPPTRLIEGDQDLTIGGVRIRLIYMGNAHSDTQYAVYLPDDKLLYPPDTVSTRVFLPGGGPDLYMPGFLAALDDLKELDFETFVPSHFAIGTKQDFVESVEMLHFVQDLAEKTVRAFASGPKPMFMDGARNKAFFEAMYGPLKERYGDWHGFDQMALQAITRHATGVYVGF